MKLAIASGKGGTGKTTVAVSLALSLAEQSPLFLDCDVEQPNVALFLRPEFTERRDVGQLIPVVDAARCMHCGRCVEVCQYHALAVIGPQVLVFLELCHGCGSCTRQCPESAIHEELNLLGTLERGRAGTVEFAQGTLNVGKAMAVPVIRQLKQWAIPPGASCPVVETLRRADAVLLVTEPTLFGLHDLRVAAEVSRAELGLPVAVVINRAGVGDANVEAYCAAEGIAHGETLGSIHPEYPAQLAALWDVLAAPLRRER